MRSLNRRHCPYFLILPLISFAILALSTGKSWAQINLTWDPNTESDLAGYKVYYGTASRSYGTPINVGNVTNYTVTGLTSGIAYYFAITAYNSVYDESGFSNEVSGMVTETETVSIASFLGGPTSGIPGTSYTYFTGGSSSSLGHTVEYQFDWKGDGTDLSPWGSATQSRTWTASGTYQVKARAHCAIHPGAVSSWSTSMAVYITSTQVSYTVATSPPGCDIVVDGLTYRAPQTFIWSVGSSHALSVPTPQSLAEGARYVYASWSDGGAQTHNITAPASSATNTASLMLQFTLTTSVSGSGTVSPSGTNWYDSGQAVSISATANYGYRFAGWSGDLTGSTSPVSISMSETRSVRANFSLTAADAETVSVPTLNGPTSGVTGTSYLYTSGGSSSSLGDPSEYQFDWKGDGTDLSSWGPATQSKIWTAFGAYQVKARARCAMHPGVVSSWSSSMAVNITSTQVSYTVATSPPGCDIVVDGLTYRAPQTFVWSVGSSHTLSVPTPQPVAEGARYVYASWSDGRAQTHNITAPASSATNTASLMLQFTLTTSVSGGGIISPSGTNWYDSGQAVSVSVTASPGYRFAGWSGNLTGTTSPASITISEPKSVTANFPLIAVEGW